MALTAGVKVAWLEDQTGVRYETIRRHYGRWLRADGADEELQKLIDLAPKLAPAETRVAEVVQILRNRNAGDGDRTRTGETPTGF